MNHGAAMNLDGFVSSDKQAYRGYSQKAAARFHDVVTRVGERLHVEVEGIERIPRGGALIVGNHGFGWDVAFAMSAVWKQTGRTIWALGEHLWWEIPGLRRLAAAVGTVDGTTENVDALLAAGELVLVLPGGLREAVKPCELRYRLLWGHRYGFVRAALRHHVPIIPLAAIGADDVFSLKGDALARGRKWLHRTFPLPVPAHVPHRARLRYVFGEPIRLPFQEETPETLRLSRFMVEGALHELIDLERARRAGIAL
jgi:1-acyl-sn-glycerol-3-phosphate acyltransferase